MIATRAATMTSVTLLLWNRMLLIVMPNVRAKLAPTVGRAGQVGENVQGTADLDRVARRWGST